jgi:hypothetical protein
MRVNPVYSRTQKYTNEFSVIYYIFRDIPAKLSRSAKQHPPNMRKTLNTRACA